VNPLNLASEVNAPSLAGEANPLNLASEVNAQSQPGRHETALPEYLYPPPKQISTYFCPNRCAV